MNRVIIFGRVDFKNKRSVKLARAEYVRTNETIAKNDLIFRPEVIFGEDPEVEYDKLYIEFDRKIHEAENKTLHNTLSTLRKLLQFAIAGRIDVFILEAGELPRQEILLVENDKSTCHAMAAGMEAFEEKRYADSIEPFSDAIDSFASHPWAYNQRALAHYELGDLEKAEADFKQARSIYSALPSPHLGLAKIAHDRGQRAATIDNCDKAMAGSIPHQPGYWICALFKAQVLIDIMEQGLAKDDAERKSFMNITRTLLDRYQSKLRQLGSARNEYYPEPAELEKLRERYDVLAEASAQA